MYGETDFSKLVKEAFDKHGVENPKLEKAIADVFHEALDTRALSRRLYKAITENQERDKDTIKRFRG